MLKEQYVNNDTVRYYYKHHATLQEYEEQTDKYRYALLTSCVATVNKERFVEFYESLFETPVANPQEGLKRAVGYGTQEGALRNCLDSLPEALRSDIAEVELLGMVGVEPHIYVGINGKDNTIITGVPSVERMHRIIRTYEVRLGQ